MKTKEVSISFWSVTGQATCPRERWSLSSVYFASQDITYFLLSETKRHNTLSRCQKDPIKIWHEQTLAGGVERTQLLQTCSHGSNSCSAGSWVIPVVFVRTRFCPSCCKSSDDCLWRCSYTSLAERLGEVKGPLVSWEGTGNVVLASSLMWAWTGKLSHAKQTSEVQMVVSLLTESFEMLLERCRAFPATCGPGNAPTVCCDLTVQSSSQRLLDLQLSVAATLGCSGNISETPS